MFWLDTLQTSGPSGWTPPGTSVRVEDFWTTGPPWGQEESKSTEQWIYEKFIGKPEQSGQEENSGAGGASGG